MNRTFNILLVAGCLTSIAATWMFSVKPAGTTDLAAAQSETAIPPSLPALKSDALIQLQDMGIPRQIQLKTQLQDGVSYEVSEYTAKSGDSLWSIAQQFDLQPETILWGNEWLSSVGVLQIGDTLKILPTDGVLHTVREGDTLETLQHLYGTPAEEIFEYFGNEIDLTQPPTVTVDQQIIVPNGTSTIVWSEAQAPVAETGSSSSSKYPNLGTGYFVLPVAHPDWGAFMVKPLLLDTTAEDARHLFGIGTDRFLSSWLDTT